MSQKPLEAPTELTPKQLIVITKLATGASIRAVAQSTEVNEKTIDKWLKLPVFKQEIRKQVEVIYDAFLNKAIANLDKIHARLMSIIDDPDSRPSDICSSARLLLDSAHRFKENTLEVRLAELEVVVEELTSDK